MKYYGKIKGERRMKNYEWIIKNWNKKMNVTICDKTVGILISKNSACGFIKKCKPNCWKCIEEWLNAEATKDNNLYFDDVQED